MIINSRLLKFILSVLFLIGLAVPIFLYYYDLNSCVVNSRNNISQNRFPKPTHEISGLIYERHVNGKTVFLIKAVKFILQKKKLGCFRFGLMSEGILQNAFIQIYGKCKLSDNNSKRNFEFDNVYSQTISLFPTKRISSIIMKPINVELYTELSLVTRISADTAIICSKKHEFFFKGGVRVVSGSNILTANRLSMLPEGVIKSDGYFILKTPEKEIKGDKIITDIFLKPIDIGKEIK